MPAAHFTPLTGFRLAFAAVVLALGNFVVILDTTITNVAMPTIAGYLGVSANEGTWIITSYAVAEAVTVPITGWLSRQFGQVRVFVVSITLFVLFSVCCGLSWSLPMLVFFRILQGLAGGPLIPLSSTLLLAAFPKEKSHVALSLWGMMSVVAPIIGPIAGGIITDNWSWQWVFYINIGFGLIVGLGTLWVLQGRETAIHRTRFDAVGLLLLVVFVSAFQIMLDKGRDLDWFSSNVIIISALVATIALILLIIWETTDEHPIIDFSVFKSRNWLFSTLCLCVMFGTFFGHAVLTPLWLQQWMGYTPTWSGYVLAPTGILAVITSPIIGRLLPKLDPRLIVTYGLGILTASFVMRAMINTDVDFLSLVIPVFLLGAGLPACFITLAYLAVSDLPQDKVPSGAGLQNFFRILFMAIGSSLTQTYWEHMTKFSRAELVAAITPHSAMQQIAQFQELHLSHQSAIARFSAMVDSQAALLAINDFYQTGAILMICAIAIIWLVKRTPRKAPDKANS